jgi:ABC-type uncharacterized transport system permease subunit
MIGLFYSCGKTEDKEQTYKTYSVEYLLQNNLNKGKRFTITYKNPAFANKTTESYENILDTLWVRFEAKSLDLLYMSGLTMNDTADYRISIYVDSELIKSDSTSCNWQCESTFVELEYPLP